MKPFIPILLLLLMLVCPAYAFSGSGSGTAEDPYLISTPAQFLEIKNDGAKYYRLTADLDMTGKPWTTQIEIGSSSPGFTLDGDGHIVSNLVITSSYSSSSNGFRGMFRKYGPYPVTFKDIVFENPVLSASGASNSAGSTCYMAFLVTSSTSSGGSGPAQTLTFERVGIVNGTLTQTSGYDSSTTQRNGMFVGYATKGDIYFKNCFATGTIKSNSDIWRMDAGGFVGGMASTVTLEDCYVDVAFVNARTKGAFFGGSVQPTTVGVSMFNAAQAPYYDTSHTHTVIVPCSASEMRDEETYEYWDIPSTWQMSTLDSPLEGYPAFSFMTDYLPPPVEPDLQISITPSTSIVGKPLTVTWEDLPDSDGTDHMVTIYRGEDMVYCNMTAGLSGTDSYTPLAPATYNATYSCVFDGDNVSVTDSAIVGLPEVSWSWGTDYGVAGEPTGIATTHLSTTYPYYRIIVYDEEYHPIELFLWSGPFSKAYPVHLVTEGMHRAYLYGSNEGVVFFPIVAEPLELDVLAEYPTPEGLRVTLYDGWIGNPYTPVTWVIPDDITVLPDSGEPIASFEIVLYHWEGARRVNMDTLSNIPRTGEHLFMPTSSQLMPDVNGITDEWGAEIIAISTTGTKEVITSDQQGYTIALPVFYLRPFSGEPVGTATETNITVTLAQGSIFGMSQYKPPYLQFRNFAGDIFGKYPITLENHRVEIPSADLEPGTYFVDLVMERRFASSLVIPVGSWPVIEGDLPGLFMWKDKSSGEPITSTQVNVPVGLYARMPTFGGDGSQDLVDVGYDWVTIDLFKFNPVTDQWEHKEKIFENMNSVMFTDPPYWNVFGRDVTFTTPGNYLAVLHYQTTEYDLLPRLTYQTEITVQPNWLNPDYLSEEGGKIFGIDFEALKMVAGVLLVLGFAAVPPIIVGNTHPMVIMLGASCGFVAAIALGLIPWWAALLIGILAAALLVMNVSGGGKTYISNDYSGPRDGGGFAPPPPSLPPGGGGPGAGGAGNRVIHDLVHERADPRLPNNVVRPMLEREAKSYKLPPQYVRIGRRYYDSRAKMRGLK